jgi:hypothetical protein
MPDVTSFLVLLIQCLSSKFVPTSSLGLDPCGRPVPCRAVQPRTGSAHPYPTDEPASNGFPQEPSSRGSVSAMRPRPENLTRTSVHWQTVQYPHISLPQPHAGHRFEMEHTPPDDDSPMAAEKERMILISSRECSRERAGVTPSVVRSDRFFSSAAH